MTRQNKQIVTKAVADARLLKKHIIIAEARNDGSSDDFVRRLKMAYKRAVDKINAFTSIGIIMLCVLALSGCGAMAKFRPNTVKGHHLDEIDKHTLAIQRVDPIIYERNEQVLPARIHQLSETANWNDRMKASMEEFGGNK